MKGIRTSLADVREHYRDSRQLSKRADLYSYSTGPVTWRDWLLERIDLPRGARVLEVGCGAGWLWSSAPEGMIKDRAFYLSDLSSGMVAEARTSLHDAGQFTFLCADSQTLPFPDDSFDVLMACHMLYHVPDRQRAIAEFARVLRSGGRLYASTMSKRHLKEFWDCFAAVDRPDLQTYADNFGLENGAAQLAEQFSAVSVECLLDELVVPDAEPLLAYAESTERLSSNQLQRLGQLFRDRLKDGPMRIQKDVGVFIASNS